LDDVSIHHHTDSGYDDLVAIANLQKQEFFEVICAERATVENKIQKSMSFKSSKGFTSP
jgi:hypothetical protein